MTMLCMKFKTLVFHICNNHLILHIEMFKVCKNFWPISQKVYPAELHSQATTISFSFVYTTFIDVIHTTVRYNEKCGSVIYILQLMCNFY